ncbi:MAG: response regulator [Pseudomonadota bacterium]|nr:response regulator [Pseudomonadota bacterium]
MIDDLGTPLPLSLGNGRDEAGERPRVLVVDDDERNLLAIENVLEDVGEVVVARSGEEALRHLLKGEFAVILLDVYMPQMDGYECAQIIRSREQTKRIPIVFLSAVNKEAEHLLKGYAMGAVDYVFKPVDPIVLRSKVAVFVDLFAKSKEIERKARQEQALLDENLRANTERLHAVEALRQAEVRQAAIVTSLPLVLYLEPLDDSPRKPSYVSGNLALVTGYELAAVASEPDFWASRIHDDDRTRVLAAIEQRRGTGALSVQYRWRCADGNYKHLHDQAVLLRNAAGEPVEYAGSLADISDRKELETQLVQAQKMDAIGKLTGGIAHDFNNLLAAVIGGLGLLERRGNLAEEQRKIVTMTRRAAEQGSELVGRLLAFARRQQLQPAAIEIGRLADAVTDLLAHTLGGRVELDWDLSPKLAPAWADQAQLELALLNLIINARDAMPTGGTIRMVARDRELKREDHGLAAGNYVVLSVTDTGCGISPDHLEQVLEPFFTTKEVGKGTGLGLSMVYGFAQQSGGAFRLASEVGEGTTAEIWLPRAMMAQVPAAAPVELGLAETPPLDILLVDDHADVRRTTAAMLEELGHRVVEAQSGHDALALLDVADRPCDLIVTDYAMPRLSGTDLVREARSRRARVPALIVTGYADADAIGERPADVAILAKPFTLEGLSRAVACAADRTKSRSKRPAAS